MAEKFTLNKDLPVEELAKHLRKPEGEDGRQLGYDMNKGNKNIILNAYKQLEPLPNTKVLEIGMGNAYYAKDILAMNKGLHYTGVDYSEIMVTEACHINKDFMNERKVKLICASVEQLPFPDNSFEYIVTTNTVYFWPSPVDNLMELLRVLKPGGKFVNGYSPKILLDKLEVTNYGFKKYEIAEIELLMDNAGFCDVFTKIIQEPDIEYNGEIMKVESVFTIGGK